VGWWGGGVWGGWGGGVVGWWGGGVVGWWGGGVVGWWGGGVVWSHHHHHVTSTLAHEHAVHLIRHRSTAIHAQVRERDFSIGLQLLA
jgi:hypothetical protein